jgi:hypothetical protein
LAFVTVGLAAGAASWIGTGDGGCVHPAAAFNLYLNGGYLSGGLPFRVEFLRGFPASRRFGIGVATAQMRRT